MNRDSDENLNLRSCAEILETKERPRPVVLLVDDEPVTLKIVAAHLERLEYEIVSCSSPEQALAEIEKNQFDLALLDISMPGMNGIELCRRIQEIPEATELPVIFLTASEGVSSKVEAFEAGAMDYLTKPVKFQELAARVKTHIDLAFARKELRKYARFMEELAEQRAQQLIHAERLATLGTLAAGLAHEIKNPLTYVKGNIEILQEIWCRADETIAGLIAGGVRIDKGLMDAVTEIPEVIRSAGEGCIRILDIANTFTRFSRREMDKKAPFNLDKCLNRAIKLVSRIKKNRVEIVLETTDHDLCMDGLELQIEQVLINLLGNAADAAADVDSAPVIVSLRRISSNEAGISILDRGTGIPPENLENIWKPFFSTKSSDRGTGLGLSISNAIVENHGGTISASNRTGGGAEFYIVLPVMIEGES